MLYGLLNISSDLKISHILFRYSLKKTIALLPLMISQLEYADLQFFIHDWKINLIEDCIF